MAMRHLESVQEKQKKGGGGGAVAHLVVWLPESVEDNKDLLDTTKIFYPIVHICSQNVMHYAICKTPDQPTWEEHKYDG